MSKTWPILIILALALVVIVLLFGSSQCHPPPATPTPTVTPITPTVERKTSTWIPTHTPTGEGTTATLTHTPTVTSTALFQVRRETPVVRKGVAPDLSELTDDGFQPLPDGQSVSTAEGGEALLTAELAGGTCKVYLFETSRVTKSACPKSTRGTGNTACLEEGSALFQNCSGYLIMTPSGDVQVEGPSVPILLKPGTPVPITPSPPRPGAGSSILVVYKPEWQLTMVTVYTGTVSLSPVLQFETRQLGTATRLSSEEFLFTAPDDAPDEGQNKIQELAQLAPVTARTAVPLAHLAPLTQTLGIKAPIFRTSGLLQVFDLYHKPTPTPKLTTVILTATSDTSVYEGSVKPTPGKATVMNIGFGSDPQQPCAASWSYIQFDLQKIPDDARIQSVVLRLHQNEALKAKGTKAFAIALALTSWQAETLTWKNPPKMEDIGQFTVAIDSVWREYDLSEQMGLWVKKKAHIYGFVLRPVSKCDGGWERSFDTLESKYPPQLRVVYVR